MDQLLEENVAAFEPMINQLHFQQQSLYSTHNNGGILDLVFDNENKN